MNNRTEETKTGHTREIRYFVYARQIAPDWFNELVKNNQVIIGKASCIILDVVGANSIEAKAGDYIFLDSEKPDSLFVATPKELQAYIHSEHITSPLAGTLKQLRYKPINETERFLNGEINLNELSANLLERANAKIERLEQANERLNNFVESVRDLLAEI